MGDSSQQVKHIDETRSELRRNVNELEKRVRRTFDWRAQFEQRPMTSLGIVFGAGLLLSRLVGSPSHSGNQNGHGGAATRKATEAWENIKGAAVGVAAAKFRNFLEEAIPGFEEHYKATEEERKSAS